MAISGGDGSIVLTTQIDQTGLKRGMASMKSGVAGLSKSFAKIGAAIGVAFGVGALINFGKQAVQLASDLQEVQNVVDTAFGSMSYKIEEFADKAIDLYGISALTAKRTASTYMAMAKGMGIAEEAGSDMAITLTGLTADMASFYNVSQEMADTAIKSVFTGETESLKQYGIVMTEVNLEQFALSKGITKSLSAMNQQEKTMLRYLYVLEQTSLAQGDFAKTQDSWANQTRILSERWKEVQTTFGEAFITIGELLLPVINALVKSLSYVAQAAKNAAQNIAGLFGRTISDTQDQAESIKNAVDYQNSLTDAIEETADAQKKSLASFDQLNILKSKQDSGGDTIDFESLLPSTEIIDRPINNESETYFDNLSRSANTAFKNIVSYFNATLSPLFTELKQFGSTAFSGLADSAGKVFNDIKQKVVPEFVAALNKDILPLLSDISENIVDLGTTASEESKELFDSIYEDAISPFLKDSALAWNEFWDTAKEAYDERGEDVFEKMKTALQSIGDLLNHLWDEIFAPVFESIQKTARDLWKNHLKPLWDNVFNFFYSIIEFIITAWNFVQPFIKKIIDNVAPLIINIRTTIVSIFGTIFAVVSNVLSGIMELLSGVLDFLTGVFTGDWEKALEGLEEIFSGMWNGLVGIVEGAINLIIDGLNLLWSGIYGAVAGVINGIGGIIEGVGKFIGQDWGFSIPKEAPKISKVELPRLARGAVIPPNREFLAVLGDQRSGTNIETPLSTMIEAFKTALSESGYGGRGNMTVVLQVGKRELGRTIVELGNQERQRVGVSLA